MGSWAHGRHKSRAEIAGDHFKLTKKMQREIYNLYAQNKPLPKGTRIKTTQGGMHTGGDHELSDDQLKNANRMVNGYLPLWITGWADLHDDLIIPTN